VAPKDKLKKTIAEDRKRLLLRLRKLPWAQYLAVGSGVGLSLVLVLMADLEAGLPLQAALPLVLAGVPKAFTPLEIRVVRAIQKQAEAIELNEQGDGKDKSPNPLLDEFGAEYCGGHPNWQVTKPEFGQIQLYERALVFKNLKNRFRLPLSRVNRITLESQLQLKMRKLGDVLLPSTRVPANPLQRRIVDAYRKRLRMVLIDYTDDQGQSRLIAMWPTRGNVRAARQVKEGIDAALTRLGKERNPTTPTARNLQRPPLDPMSGAIGPNRPLPPNMPAPVREVSKDAIAAAQQASQPQSSGPSVSTVMQDVSAAKTCPYCKFSLKEPVVHCSVCGLEHHEGCWKANFGCTKECTKAKAIQGPRPEVPPTADAPAATAPEPAQPLPPAPAPHTPAALPARFQVVLGDAGKTPEQQDAVARQMAQDFGIELDKVRIVLARLPAVARRNLDEAEARTLAERFRTMGADASVQVMA
jgi:hypothetical protein